MPLDNPAVDYCGLGPPSRWLIAWAFHDGEIQRRVRLSGRNLSHSREQGSLEASSEYPTGKCEFPDIPGTVVTRYVKDKGTDHAAVGEPIMHPHGRDARLLAGEQARKGGSRSPPQRAVELVRACEQIGGPIYVDRRIDPHLYAGLQRGMQVTGIQLAHQRLTVSVASQVGFPILGIAVDGAYTRKQLEDSTGLLGVL